MDIADECGQCSKVEKWGEEIGRNHKGEWNKIRNEKKKKFIWIKEKINNKEFSQLRMLT